MPLKCVNSISIGKLGRNDASHGQKKGSLTTWSTPPSTCSRCPPGHGVQHVSRNLEKCFQSIFIEKLGRNDASHGQKKVSWTTWCNPPGTRSQCPPWCPNMSLSYWMCFQSILFKNKAEMMYPMVKKGSWIFWWTPPAPRSFGLYLSNRQKISLLSQRKVPKTPCTKFLESILRNAPPPLLRNSRLFKNSNFIMPLF